MKIFVLGTYTGNDKMGTLEWTDPETRETKMAWGEFDVQWDEHGCYVTHDEYDQDGRLLYSVRGAYG